MSEACEDEARLLRDAAERLARWTCEEALPVWSGAGFHVENGRFLEALDPETGEPADRPVRARVPPRQIYSVIAGGSLGWGGNWRKLAGAALDRYLADFFQAGPLAIKSVNMSGEPVDEGVDIYDQAFALFAFANVAEAMPSRRDEMSARAASILTAMREDLSHPMAGFEEANPRNLPLRSNPHMHLFEAALAWEALEPEGPWRELADEIGGLALSKFVAAETGALREFFDGEFKPAPGEDGRRVEPGHQFEWAWLLARWGRSRGNENALAVSRRLFEIGECYGIDEKRGVCVMAIDDEFQAVDPVARLWGQTEWLKAALLLGEMSSGAERKRYLASAVKAVAAMERFFDVPVRGLYRDRMLADGSFILEPAPASSLYHVVCAIVELCNHSRNPNERH
ncbi:AGE family epimerase/isomerase [Rhizobiales bacterium]|uniref:AGE family epimerase/isomerase n=1 Tax=Hongsoonwoonella zoysiae TaxID=2821844 RepID=UPI0015606C66|nr:AGE family epimerase/isomerase [Hongsoonwoonella zoysiae]NRG18560.1 AGE family epimerase/isomerase [Hongsoonwoonella zoysiae]